MKNLNIKSYLAEFIGTLILVFVGCGTACVVDSNTAVGSGNISIALAFGLVIVALAYSVGNISGCHVNPAVSLAMFINKKMTSKDFLGYVISQVLGGIAGAGLLCVFVGRRSGLGANALYSKDFLKTFLIEAILTFIFVFAILGVTSKAKNAQVSGIVIGLTLALVHIIGIQFTGTSVNPARSLGPALISGGEALKNVWVFILAPLFGSVIAAFTWKSIGNKN